MTHKSYNKLVYTLKDRCRVCYTCVRECPVKAIKIINGQAEVINERCIACGNCVKVCSQGAKVFQETTNEVHELLQSGQKVAACIAPSFPAEFDELDDYKELVGMLRKLGFDYIVEVAFGADMVSQQYKKILNDENAPPGISSDCPAIVYYIEKYHPELVDKLAKVVSPMVATKRVVKKKYGDDVKTVFIGPCIAKKAESDEIDEAITFTELREMLTLRGITKDKTEASEFDPPLSGKAAIFPVSRGMLHSVNVSEDISEGNVVVADGKTNFRDAIDEFENGMIRQHLELLCCEGCIMGAGMSKDNRRYARRVKISNYVRNKLKHLDTEQWKKDVDEFSRLDYSQVFHAESKKTLDPPEEEITKVLHEMGKYNEKDHLNCGACGYDTCYEHAVAVAQGLAENEMCLPFTIDKLHNYISELNISNEKLASTQQALKQSEKLANMGQLSAGIAHELNNPLGVITMYSNILLDETQETDPVREDLNLIVEQAERCKKIVGGLLNFARKSQVNHSKTNIVDFVEKSLESIVKPSNVEIKFSHNMENPEVMIDNEQMMQVLTNLEKNAIEAMPKGGELLVELFDKDNNVFINISDTGTGIEQQHMDKIFTPFYTTKEVGKGTGLGLPLVYGVIKMHKGKIDVESNTDPGKGKTGTAFKIRIPRSKLN